MFNWQELEDLKKASMDKADNATRESAGNHYLEVLVYQNEQILRELKSLGWKLHKMNEASSTTGTNVGSDYWKNSGVTSV